jgi:hypothetical protein
MVKQLPSSTAPLRALREALVAAGAPEDKATKMAAALVSSIELRAATVPVESPDMSIAEVAIFRHESPSTVQRKMRTGAYVSYLSGNDKRLITRESVLRDREACLARGPRFGEVPPGQPAQPPEDLVEEARAHMAAREEASPEAAKRGRGRPRKAISPGRGGEGQPGSEGPPATV